MSKKHDSASKLPLTAAPDASVATKEPRLQNLLDFLADNRDVDSSDVASLESNQNPSTGTAVAKSVTLTGVAFQRQQKEHYPTSTAALHIGPSKFVEWNGPPRLRSSVRSDSHPEPRSTSSAPPQFQGDEVQPTSLGRSSSTLKSTLSTATQPRMLSTGPILPPFVSRNLGSKREGVAPFSASTNMESIHDTLRRPSLPLPSSSPLLQPSPSQLWTFSSKGLPSHNAPSLAPNPPSPVPLLVIEKCPKVAPTVHATSRSFAAPHVPKRLNSDSSSPLRNEQVMADEQENKDEDMEELNVQNNPPTYKKRKGTPADSDDEGGSGSCPRHRKRPKVHDHAMIVSIAANFLDAAIMMGGGYDNPQMYKTLLNGILKNWDEKFIAMSSFD